MFICVCLWLIFLTSCGSRTADLRSLIPADSLVYLESNDLGAVMKAITDRPAFREAAKTVPDFSVLNGVKLAVAVTGFETKEQPVTDESSVLNFQPRFVAVLETNAWNYQALAFTEQKLGEFINNAYGGEVLLETSDKHDGKYFVWKANDGRKAYALVQGSVIFFGNDETAIEKCLAVKRGEADSIAKNPKITNGDRLAFGYVSPDGVAQISNLLGVKYASEASDEPELQSAVAGILPKLLRNTVTEVILTASKSDEGITDEWTITLPSDASKIFTETFAVGEETSKTTIVNNEFLAQFPRDVLITTRYNLKTPDLAWRSVLLVAGKGLDPLDAKILSEFNYLLFAPYGIRDPELFLSSLGGEYQISRNIFTAKINENSDQSVVVAGRGDDKKTLASLLSNLKPPKQIVEGGLNVWSTPEGEIQVAFDFDAIKIGSKHDLPKINGPRLGELSDIRSDLLRVLSSSKAPIATVGRDPVSTAQIAEMLAGERSDEVKADSTYSTETRFTKTGIERRTVSDFGFIGWIITQFGKDQ